MDMFSQNELILMILVVSVLLVFIVILTILDIREYKKNKDLIDLEELDSKEEEAKEEVVSLKDDFDEPTIMEIVEKEPIKEEVIEVKKEELPLFEEVEEEIKPIIAIDESDSSIEEIEPNKIDLHEELNKIEKTMVSDEKAPSLTFEEEQERTAIISLDELMAKSNTLYDANEVMQYDDGNEPITIDEVINMFNQPESEASVPEVMEDIVTEKKELYSKKENIPFISSIYGMEKNDMAFENTANFEKFDRAKSQEFMKRLKEMNENK